MNYLKNYLTVRGDNLYCPLCLSLDTYSNCDADCVDCFLRRLNYVWDRDNRPAAIEGLKSKLINGMKNPNPKSPLAWALKQKKVIRLGNKSDPFQIRERVHHISKHALLTLRDLQWPTVIRTKFLSVLSDYWDILSDMKKFLWIMPWMSPGMEMDWEILERKKTDHPDLKIQIAQRFIHEGFQVGFNGESFIPGFHTLEQFEETLRRLSSIGVKSYNTYNLHANLFVYRRLLGAGIDIGKILTCNQDDNWRPILQELIQLSKKYQIRLGCPDFVNSGWDYHDESNTCCGLNVSNPCLWNSHTFKRKTQEGKSNDQILQECWDHIGNYEQGKIMLEESSPKFFCLKDVVSGQAGKVKSVLKLV